MVLVISAYFSHTAQSYGDNVMCWVDLTKAVKYSKK